MAADGRFGGHIVSGHIDGTGRIHSMRRDENAVWISIETEPEIMELIVEKGSICIDGISLTVAEAAEQSFSVSVIPHTGEETTLLKKKPGDRVNLENDIVGKYVQKFLLNGNLRNEVLKHGASGTGSLGNGAVENGASEKRRNREASGITMDFLREYEI